MASIFSIVNLRLLSLIKTLGDNPGNTNNIVRISDFLYFGAKMHPEMIKMLNKELLEKPEFVEIYEKDKNPKNHLEDDYKLEVLLKYPIGTLGYEYAIHMQKQHLSQKYYPNRKIDSPITFLRQRLFKTHDIWHVVTGFDITPTGEFALQAFYLAQFPNIIQFCIMLSPFIRVLMTKENKDIGNLMKIITTGYQMGKTAKPIEFIVWEDKWGEYIEDIRKEFNISSIEPDFSKKYIIS